MRYLKELWQSNIIGYSIIISVILYIVVFTIDKNNFISELIKISSIYIVILSYISINIFFVIKMRLLEAWKLKTINIIDRFALILYFFSIIAIIDIYLNNVSDNLVFKVVLTVSLLILVLKILIYRQQQYQEAINKSEQYKSNVIDLKSLYEGDIENLDDNIILLDEKDVDYDMLNRSIIINQIYYNIVGSKSNNSFVLALDGEWGSGKTTLINNVKKKLNNDYIIIDDFDPWIYDNQQSMLMEMFNKILNNVNVKYNLFENKKLIKRILDITLKKIGVGDTISDIFIENINSIEEIKEKVEMFLKVNNKNIVFFIDNIERANADNIIFLFKLIGRIFDLKRITYVICYDKKRLNTIFSDKLKIDYRYLEKIIQVEIAVPTIQKSLLYHIIETCVRNILLLYGENEQEISKYKNIFDLIKIKISDLRQLKRMLNTTVFIPFVAKHGLSKKIMFALSVIKFFDNELYIKIYQNKQYFICFNELYDKKIFSIHINRNEINKKGKEFFCDVLKNRDEYRILLEELFITVSRYYSEKDIISDYCEIDYEQQEREQSISNGMYFDLYFSYSRNEFVFISNDVKNFIKIVENSDGIFINRLVKEKIDSVNISYLTNEYFWFSDFCIYIDDIKKNKLVVIKALYKNILTINNIIRFMEYSSQFKIIIKIFKYLQQCNIYEYMEMMKLIKFDYKRLKIIDTLQYCFQDGAIIKERRDIEKVKQRIIRNLFEEICETIIEKKINLYEDKYYGLENLSRLMYYYKDENEKIKNYIIFIMNKKNVYRLLGDFVRESIGSEGYGYYINIDLANKFIEGKIKLNIDEFTKINPPKTESEKFILEVYEIYLKQYDFSKKNSKSIKEYIKYRKNPLIYKG